MTQSARRTSQIKGTLWKVGLEAQVVLSTDDRPATWKGGGQEHDVAAPPPYDDGAPAAMSEFYVRY